MSTPIDTVIILTHMDPVQDAVLLPHYHHLEESNPDLNVHVVVSQETGMGKMYYWKNGDIPLREWWIENSDVIDGEGFAVIEWDTLVNTQLPEIPENLDLVGKQRMDEDLSMRGQWKRRRMSDPLWEDKYWFWWPDIMCFDPVPAEPCVGLISFGAFFMRRKVLDMVADERWDQVYKESVQNELRFPTCAHLSGARVGEIPLPGVQFNESSPGPCGIYHSVKEPYDD